MKRIFDILSSLVVLVLASPVFVFIALAIVLDSKGGIFYKQSRVGQFNKDFFLYKFRTMVTDADKKGQLTVGAKDSRVTKVGYFLRKYKLDEFPQLINILKGEMSVVGPRPEVRKYVQLYNPEQLKVLNAKPGLTDYASLEFSNENEILAKYTNPEKAYIEEVMPKKLALNLKYISEIGFLTDLKLIIKTIFKIVS